jgi:hypothetical protein
MADAIDTNNDANNKPQQLLSRRAAKKAKRKQQKAEKKRQALNAFMLSSSSGYNNAQQHTDAVASTPTEQHAISNTTNNTTLVGGKASRARLARQHDNNLIALPQTTTKNNDASDNNSNSSSWQHHRPQGGAPILSQISPQHIHIVEYLERKEQFMRVQGRGVTMKERMLVEVDCHGRMDWDVGGDVDDNNNILMADNTSCRNESHCRLSRMNLRGNFTLASLTSSLIALPSPTGTQLPPIISNHNILHLDLSRNELWNISSDALEPLGPTLQTLDISRNWFESLPVSIGTTTLVALKELRATHNLLKPNALNEDGFKGMKELTLVDLRFNQKCGKQSLLESLQSTLGTNVEVKLTVTYPPPSPQPSDASCSQTSDKVGESPAVRDATLLRSQLEPWSTMALRRRLVADFGEKRTNDGKSWADEDVTRGQVMEQLLTLYHE